MFQEVEGVHYKGLKDFERPQKDLGLVLLFFSSSDVHCFFPFLQKKVSPIGIRYIHIADF